MKRMFGAAAVIVAALVVLLGFKISQQRSAESGPAGGSGVVEGTAVRVSSRVGGRITRVAVREGEAVERGQVLLELDCTEPEAMLAEAEARLQATREQAAAAERGAIAAQAGADAASSSVRAASAQARAVAHQGDAADRQAARIEAVTQDVSEAMRDQARTAADASAAQADAASAQRRAGQSQARAASGQAEAASAQARAAAQQVAAVEAGLERARLAASECQVIASRDGVVELLPFEEGELVGPGATLARLIDLRVVTAAFYLPNADLAAAAPGGSATLLADAWPDRVFEGRVATVATSPEFTPRNIQTRTDRDRLVYRVEVDVDNADGALRPGMPVEVRLASEQP